MCQVLSDHTPDGCQWLDLRSSPLSGLRVTGEDAEAQRRRLICRGLPSSEDGSRTGGLPNS